MQKLKLILSVVISLLLVSNCYGSQTAWSYFLEGNYKKAITEAEKDENAQNHYIMGLSYLKLGKPSHARKHFVFILDVYPGSDLKEECSLSIADSFFLEGDFNEASAHYKSFLNSFRSSGMASLAYLRLGQSQRRLGEWQDARNSLLRVAQNYSSAAEAKEANAELAKEFYYYVQTGSFTGKSNANSMLKKLKNENFNAYINAVPQGEKTFYRVCIGNFQTKAEAVAVCEKLQAKGYKSKIYP